jgi:hypothetical protein
MKSGSSNKEFNFSLHNIDNYKKELTTSIDEIMEKYTKLIIDYYKFILENIQLKNKVFARFIIIRGLDTITNVFLFLLLYTKNIDITYFHCQKSFYFYVEFVGQITEDDKVFLQLSSRDASTYVYKKTIFEINKEFKKINESTPKEQLNVINSYITLYKNYLTIILSQDNFDTNKKYLTMFEKFADNLNNNLINREKIKVFEKIVNKLDNKVTNIELFFEINQQIIKRFIKKNDILDKCDHKFLLDDFQDKIMESTDKFINWFLH